jgi:hypothetical protein
MTGTTALVAEANEAARPAGNIAASLTSALGELSINMRLVALNAQVRSVQITHVTGLEVLAVRTAEISNNITAVSREVSERLVQLRAVTEEMFGMFDSLCREGREREEAMDRDQTLAVFQSISEAVEQVRRVAGEAQRQLAEIPAAHAGVQKAEQDLTEFGDRFCRDDGASSDDLARVLSSHAQTYTMASERHIHEAITRGEEPVLSRATVETEAELFHETYAGQDSTPETKPENREPAPASQRPSAPLGSNIDLF